MKENKTKVSETMQNSFKCHINTEPVLVKKINTTARACTSTKTELRPSLFIKTTCLPEIQMNMTVLLILFKLSVIFSKVTIITILSVAYY